MHEINIAKILPFLKLVGATGGSGGGSDASTLDSLIDGSITEISSNAKTIINHTFQHRKQLVTANFPLATNIGTHTFNQCSQLTTVNLPLVTSLGMYCFNSCINLTTVNFPLATSVDTYAFEQCTQLTTADFPVVTSINASAFAYCSRLKTLILRSETMASLGKTSAFTGTPINSGTGYIYVPSALVDTYKAGTNWSTFASQFRALEDYTVDGTITGELDESKI